MNPCIFKQKEQDSEAVVQSRGGLTTKIHATSDVLGNPVRFILSAGQASEYGLANVLIEGFSAGFVLADRGYDSHEFLLEIKGSGVHRLFLQSEIASISEIMINRFIKNVIWLSVCFKSSRTSGG